MAVHAFGLDSLKQVDRGIVAKAWEASVQRAIRDCCDRPTEDRIRKVVLQAEFAPADSQNGVCDDVNVTVQVKETIPAVTTQPVVMSIRRKGNQLMLAFQDQSEEE